MGYRWKRPIRKLPELSETVHITQNELYGLDYLVVVYAFIDNFDYRQSSTTIPLHSAVANPEFISGGTKQ